MSNIVNADSIRLTSHTTLLQNATHWIVPPRQHLLPSSSMIHEAFSCLVQGSGYLIKTIVVIPGDLLEHARHRLPSYGHPAGPYA